MKKKWNILGYVTGSKRWQNDFMIDQKSFTSKKTIVGPIVMMHGNLLFFLAQLVPYSNRIHTTWSFIWSSSVTLKAEWQIRIVPSFISDIFSGGMKPVNYTTKITGKKYKYAFKSNWAVLRQEFSILPCLWHGRSMTSQSLTIINQSKDF